MVDNGGNADYLFLESRYEEGGSFCMDEIARANVTNATSMRFMFKDASLKDNKLFLEGWGGRQYGSGGDPGRNQYYTRFVTSMEGMFEGATETLGIYNQAFVKTGLDFMSVTSTRRMFANGKGCCVKNANFSAAKDMTEMFANTGNQCQGSGDWNFAADQVTSMKGLFKGSAINREFTGCFPKLEDASEVFMNAGLYNYPVTAVNRMGCSMFITSTRDMFRNASSFVKDAQFRSPVLGDVSGMFAGTSMVTASGQIAILDSEVITDMSYMFANSKFNGVISDTRFKTGNVTNMEGMFENTLVDLKDVKLFSYPDPRPGGQALIMNVTSCTNMKNMFKKCGQRMPKGWRSPINITLNPLQETDMSGMFEGAYLNLKSSNAFNLNARNVKNAESMFAGSTIDRPINELLLPKVTNFKNMFNGAKFLNKFYNTVDVHDSLPLDVNFTIVKPGGSNENIEYAGMEGMFYNTYRNPDSESLRESLVLHFYNKYQNTNSTVDGKIYDDTGIFTYYDEETGKNMVRTKDDGSSFQVDETTVTSETIKGFDEIEFDIILYENLNITNMTNTSYY